MAADDDSKPPWKVTDELRWKFLPWWFVFLFSAYTLYKMQAVYESPCALLGVPSPVGRREVSRAYRQVSMCTHPDKLRVDELTKRRGEVLFQRAARAKDQLHERLKKSTTKQISCDSLGAGDWGEEAAWVLAVAGEISQVPLAELAAGVGTAIYQTVYSLVTLEAGLMSTISLCLFLKMIWGFLSSFLQYFWGEGVLKSLVAIVTTPILGPIPTVVRLLATPFVRADVFLRSGDFAKHVYTGANVLVPPLHAAEVEVGGGAADDAEAKPEARAVPASAPTGGGAMSAQLKKRGKKKGPSQEEQDEQGELAKLGKDGPAGAADAEPEEEEAMSFSMVPLPESLRTAVEMTAQQAWKGKLKDDLSEVVTEIDVILVNSNFIPFPCPSQPNQRRIFKTKLIKAHSTVTIKLGGQNRFNMPDGSQSNERTVSLTECPSVADGHRRVGDKDNNPESFDYPKGTKFTDHPATATHVKMKARHFYRQRLESERAAKAGEVPARLSERLADSDPISRGDAKGVPDFGGSFDYLGTRERDAPWNKPLAYGAHAIQFDFLLIITKNVLPFLSLIAFGQVFNGLISSLAIGYVLRNYAPRFSSRGLHLFCVLFGLLHTMLGVSGMHIENHAEKAAADDLLVLSWEWDFRDMLAIINLVDMGALFTASSREGNEPSFCISYASGLALRILWHEWTITLLTGGLTAVVESSFNVKLPDVADIATRSDSGVVGYCGGGPVRATLMRC